jgi:hypothetical protein
MQSYMNTKFKIIVCLCFFLSIVSQAQHVMNVSQSNTALTRADLLNPEVGYSIAAASDSPGSRKKHKGSVLMIVGSVLLINGVVTLATSDGFVSIYFNESKGNGTYGGADLQAEAGVLLIAGGVGMIIPGAIIYSKGKKEFSTYQQENKVSLHLNGAGLKLSWRL